MHYLLTISLFLYWTLMQCYLRVVFTTCRQSSTYHSLAFIEINMLSQQWSFSVQLKIFFCFSFSTRLHASVCCSQLEIFLMADSSDTGFKPFDTVTVCGIFLTINLWTWGFTWMSRKESVISDRNFFFTGTKAYPGANTILASHHIRSVINVAVIHGHCYLSIIHNFHLSVIQLKSVLHILACTVRTICYLGM